MLSQYLVGESSFACKCMIKLNLLFSNNMHHGIETTFTIKFKKKKFEVADELLTSS